MDQTAAGLQGLHMFLLLIIPAILIGILVVMIPYWVIFKKAGFSPFLSLLLLVPGANFIMLYVLAFSQWKVVPVSQLQPLVPQAPPPQPWQPNA